MSLRTKTLLIIGIVLAVLIGSLALSTRWIILTDHSTFEQKQAREVMHRVRNQFAAEADAVDIFSKDWAQWDDCYAYMKTGSAAFIRTNMVANTFKEFNIDLLVLLDASGRIKYSQAYDRSRNALIQTNHAMLSPLLSASAARRRGYGLKSHAGICIPPAGPMIFAEQPILTTGGNGPARGLFIAGRYWHPDMTMQPDGPQYRVSLKELSDPGISAPIKRALLSQPASSAYVFTPMNETWAMVYGLLPDPSGNYSIVLQLMLSRLTNYHQVLVSLRYLFISILVVGLAGLLLAGSLLERYVTSRVSKLHRQIQAIGEGSNVRARIRMTGTDELAGLAQAMNGMLDSLEASEIRTEREQAYLAAALDILPFPLMIVTRQGEILIANRAACDMCAASAVKSWWELTVLDPLTRQPIPLEKRPCAAALRGETLRGVEGILSLPLGKDVAVLLHAAPIYHDRRITGAVVAMQDVSELKEADKAKDELLTVLSHELLTPLTSILGWLQFYRQHGKPDMLEQTFEVIERNALRQRRLVDDLLDVSRLVSGRLIIHCTPTDLWELATNAETSVAETAKERNITVTLEPPAESLPVCVEPVRIQQTIGILLSNACKFTQRGGVVTLIGRREGDRAMLSVRDTGRGIPPEMLEHIFEPFTQIERDEATGGMGLGLTLAKGLIELHGGQISVACPAECQGTVFIINLPLAEMPLVEEQAGRALAVIG
ncbi:MAG: sensor histidine kinase [Armatimonadota bacterium]